MTTEKNEDIFDAVFNINKEQLIRVLEKDPKQIGLKIELETKEEKIGYDLEGKYCLPIEILVANSDLSMNDANEMFDILVDHGAKITEVSNYDKGTLLHTAAFSGHLDIIKKVIKAGIDVNAIDEDGNTALHLATCNLKDKAVKVLVENGAELSTVIQNKTGKLPIGSIKPYFLDNEKYKEKIEKVFDILKPITERELNKEYSQGIENPKRPRP